MGACVEEGLNDGVSSITSQSFVFIISLDKTGKTQTIMKNPIMRKNFLPELLIFITLFNIMVHFQAINILNGNRNYEYILT